MTLKGLFCTSLLVTTLAAPPALALEWTVIEISPFDHVTGDPPTDPRYPRVDQAPRGIKVYLGRGDIEPGDADELSALYYSNATERVTLNDALQDGDLFKFGSAPMWADSLWSGEHRDAFPEVWLDSPGGNPFEGFKLGRLIRSLELATVVPEGAYCASACTMAFLGGVQRRIEGPYLVHAASPSDEAEDMAVVLDVAQIFSAEYVSFARQMVGNSTVAEVALSFGGGGPEGDALMLDDTQLRDWGVITVAARPQQLYPPGQFQSVNCTAASASVVTDLVCGDLQLGALDVRLTLATQRLEDAADGLFIRAQDISWRKVRDACGERESGYLPLPLKTDPLTGTTAPMTADETGYFISRMLASGDDARGDYIVHACLVDVYSARVLQLETLITYLDASAVARLAGWGE
jgi:hypothetical protein